MAISKGHVILDPSSGSGDTQLTLKAESANVGNREIVKSVFTVKAAGVSPAEITIPQDGSVVNVQVTTNTAFTVS